MLLRIFLFIAFLLLLLVSISLVISCLSFPLFSQRLINALACFFVLGYYSLCALQLPHYFDLFNKSFKVLIILFLSVSVNSYSLNKLTISSSPSSRPFKISKDVPKISANFSTVSSFGFLPSFSHLAY